MPTPETDSGRAAPTDGDGGPTYGDSPRIATRGDESAVRCPYCGHPFHERRLRTLHCGLEHPDQLSDEDQAAFERSYLKESEEIRRFRLYAIGAVVVVYFVMLFLYAVVA